MLIKVVDWQAIKYYTESIFTIKYGEDMQEITDTKFMNNASPILKKVASTHCPVLITRSEGEQLVLLSLKGYEAIERLIYEMEAYLPKNSKIH